MLALLSPLFLRGVIDNTVPGCIALQLWGIDRGEPIELTLEGNCLRDIAGCRVSWENKAAAAGLRKGEHPVLERLRSPLLPLTAGDITLSRRLPDEDNRHSLSNALSIEFFIGPEHRVLIESTSYTFDISLPQWEMSWEQENVQSFCNMEALRRHVAYNTDHFIGPAMADIRNSGFPPCVWDERLNRAEARMAIYASVHTKYRFEREGELSEAYVMGRTELLGRRAAEDEAHLPPERAAEKREWEVIDFMEPAHVKALRRAMHHPLFYETSRLTGIVQNRLMKPEPAQRERVEDYVGRYAAFVSELLATLLLVEQDRFPMDLAQRRLSLLAERMRALQTDSDSLLPADCAAEVREAAGTLIVRLDSFSAQLNS